MSLKCAQNPARWSGRFAHTATELCSLGGWMGYPLHPTWWSGNAIMRKTWQQIIVEHHVWKKWHVPCTLKTSVEVLDKSKSVGSATWCLIARTYLPLPFPVQSKLVDPIFNVPHIPCFISCSFYHPFHVYHNVVHSLNLFFLEKNIKALLKSLIPG